ncbi:MAG: ABC transporter ATP-binding protein/permease [Bacilli bacterium]|nr:ABC transporter ATP-binding protein/permease [Bacilli bacterium]
MKSEKEAKLTAFTPLKGRLFPVFLAPFLKLLECVCELFVPIMVSMIVDGCLSETGEHYGDSGYAFGLVGAIFGFAFLGFGFTIFSQYLASRVSSEFGYDLRRLIFHKISALGEGELVSFGKKKALNLTGSDSIAVQNGVFMFMRLLTRAPFLLIGSIVASFILSWLGGLFVLGAFLLCAISITFVIALTPKQYGLLQNELDQIATMGGDALVGRRLMRSFNMQKGQKEKFASASSAYRKRAIGVVKISAFANPLTFAFANLGVLLVLYIAGFNGSGDMPLSVGTIIALINYLTQSLAAFLQFTRLLNSLSKAMASKKRVDSFLSIEPVVKEGDIKELPSGDIVYSLKDVSKGFGGENLVLKNLNLSVHKGEKLGIFGGTGSGKTVLFRLLSREFDPSEGEVRLYGNELKDYAFSAYKSQIAYVGGMSGFFKGSVRDNLTLGLDYNEEEILLALEKASAKKFVLEGEGGLDREVFEKGSNFSGGQKQRLLLARAILSNRPIQIYDDALSALDAKTESEVRKAILSNDDATILFVSQRIHSFASCDRVIVLDQGQIVAEGRHEELLETCSFYREVYELQRKEV